MPYVVVCGDNFVGYHNKLTSASFSVLCTIFVLLFADLSFPAHVAAYTGDLRHLRMLIDNGIVNVNERDERGSTPAHKGLIPPFGNRVL